MLARKVLVLLRIRKGFASSRCKNLLGHTIARCGVLRKKGETQYSQTRADVAQLLRLGQEDRAAARVLLAFKESNMLGAYDLIQQYCELIIGRLPMLQEERNCPQEVKEAVAGLMYAAPRCGELVELNKLKVLFTAKFGKAFADGVVEIRHDCGLSSQLVDRLSSRPATSEVKQKMMMDIAADFNIDWKPVAESKPAEVAGSNRQIPPLVHELKVKNEEKKLQDPVTSLSSPKAASPGDGTKSTNTSKVPHTPKQYLSEVDQKKSSDLVHTDQVIFRKLENKIQYDDYTSAMQAAFEHASHAAIAARAALDLAKIHVSSDHSEGGSPQIKSTSRRTSGPPDYDEIKAQLMALKNKK